MSGPPIVYDKASLPPECDELCEIISRVEYVRGYRYPSEFLWLILVKLSHGGNPVDHPAFVHLAALLKQGTPSIDFLQLIHSMSQSMNERQYANLLQHLSNLYYPVLKALTDYDNLHPEWSFQKSTVDRLLRLTENIVWSLDAPGKEWGRRSTELAPKTEKLIALAYAHLCQDRSVFKHSPMRVPDHANRHWSRVITGETKECLLEHGHEVEGTIALLESRTFRGKTEMLSAVHVGVPALAEGAL